MNKSNVIEPEEREGIADPLTELLRHAAPAVLLIPLPPLAGSTAAHLTFRSALVPPYVRKTRSLEAALPWLYLKGVSSGEMGEALRVLVGPEAQGLSPSTVSRLKQIWAEEYRRECDTRGSIPTDGFMSGPMVFIEGYGPNRPACAPWW